jgi:hypothetical protein
MRTEEIDEELYEAIQISTASMMLIMRLKRDIKDYTSSEEE